MQYFLKFFLCFLGIIGNFMIHDNYIVFGNKFIGVRCISIYYTFIIIVYLDHVELMGR